MRNFEPLIASGHVFMYLAIMAEGKGHYEVARSYFARAFKQGLIVRLLKSDSLRAKPSELFWDGDQLISLISS